MERSLALASTLALSLGCAAQGGFSVIHIGDSSTAAEGRSVFETSYGYLLFSAEVDATTGRTWLYTSRFDGEGTYLDGRVFPGDRNLDAGLADCISRGADNTFHAAVSRFLGDPPDSAYIYHFDEFGDTIGTAFVDAQESQGFRDCEAIEDGQYWTCGWCTTNVDPLEDVACIRRIDQLGNETIRRTWPDVLRFNTINPVENGNFLVGGTRFSTADKTVLKKVNSTGEEIWTRYLGGNSTYSGGPARATLLSNGNYLVPGSWVPADSSNALERCFASLYCYNPDGDLLWRKDLRYGRLAVAVLSRYAGAGEYWVSGGYYQIPRDPDLATTIWRVNNDGDTLYSRKYWYFGGEGAANPANYGIDTTSDGGLVLSGMAREGFAGADPYRHKAWLLKLDQHGCLVPGCQNVGVQELELALQSALHLSPNPAKEHITAELLLPEGYRLQGAVQAMLLDAQGKEVRVQRMSSTGIALRTTLDVSGLPTGLYYLHLRDEVKWLAGQKVVVGTP